MPTSYSNPNISGANLAVNSPQINLPYIWDDSLSAGVGAWRPTKTGDFMTATIVDAQISVHIDKDQDSVTSWQPTHDDFNANVNLQVGDADVENSNPVPISDAGGVITVDASDLDIRSLTKASDSVDANLLIGDSDAANTNPVPVVDTLLAELATNATAEPLGFTGSSIDMRSDEYRIRDKHGYIISVEHTDDVYAGLFIVEGSMDNSNWAELETQDLTGSANTGIAYYDTWNFRYARTSVAPRGGSAAVTGKFTVRERHNG